MKLRFAFDLGTSSLGWAVYELGDRNSPLGKRENNVPIALVDLGAKVHSDGRVPKTGQSLAEIRRGPRGARRRRDRFLQRRRYVMTLLQKYGFLPAVGKDLDAIMQSDPYPLRGIAARTEITKHQFGRILVHLNQRRGFKSNRKAPSGDEESSGLIATGANKLRTLLGESGYKTLGEYLAYRQSATDVNKRLPVRIRLNGEDTKASYEFYPLREMVEAEFDVLWEQQSRFDSSLTENMRLEIRTAIFKQRPLKPVKAGRCTFYPDEERLSDAFEDAQAFRVFQMTNNLRIIHQRSEHRLSIEERNSLTEQLMSGKDLTWTRVRRLLGIDSSYQINLEEGGEKKLIGNLVAQRMEGTKINPGPFHGRWLDLLQKDRDSIIEFLSGAEDDNEVIRWAKTILGLPDKDAKLLAGLRLPNTFRRLSRKAVDMILQVLKAEVIVYSDAVAKCGLNHSDLDMGEHYTRLPPYNRVPSLQRYLGRASGDPHDPPDIRFGKISNPTVHIGLNQLRRTVNALIDRYGAPEQIVLEIARELKNSQKQKDQLQKQILINRKANDRRRDELVSMGQISSGEKRIGETLTRLKLWEELGDHPRQCPYTGRTIGQEALFSDEVEIEHILPYSRTLDNSPSNLTVAYRIANRIKTNLSPTEAAERHPDVIDLEKMLARVRLSSMPKNKKWRFEADAMDRFEDEEYFMARQLHETQFLSRLARSYVSKLFARIDDKGVSRQRVWVVPGRLTSLLRRKFGVSPTNNYSKDRNDHRHHAIDAAIIGITDRSLIQRLSTIAAREEAEGLTRLLADLPEPFDGFRQQVKDSYSNIVVGSRPKHVDVAENDPATTMCKLHEETQYGIVRDIPENSSDLKIGNVVRRKPVIELSVKEVGQIRDDAKRKSLQSLLLIDQTTGKTLLSSKQVKDYLAAWSKESGIRRLRLLKPERSIIPIAKRGTDEYYKGVVPDGNLYIDFFDDGSTSWRAYAMDTHHAHQKPNAKSVSTGQFVMRLHKGDFLQIRDLQTGENSVKRVFRLKISSGQIFLAPANEGGQLQSRHNDSDDPFRWDMASISKLKQRAARRVKFTHAGRMKTVPYGKM